MQPFDPNRTLLSGPALGMKTQAMPALGQPISADPQRTQAMSAADIPKSVSAQIVASREATMANGPAREAFLLELRGVDAEAGLPGMSTSGTRTPLNLCLVLDRSGSMQGAPLEYAKAACSHVVDLLGPNDVLSIVTFEEFVEVLMPPQRVVQKEPIKAGIQRLTLGNTTNLFEALTVGMNQVASVEDVARARRLVVLSDGDPTAGVQDFHALVSQAGEVKSRGIGLTFLGFGPDYNEELLASMAKKAGGSYAYIPRPELIPEVFRLEVDRLMSVAATHVSLDVRLARWTQLRAATGLQPLPTTAEFSMPVADLERGQVIQVVFDLEFPNHPLGHYRVMAARLHFDDALSGTRVSTDLDFVMEFTSDAARYSVPANPQVTAASQLAVASRTVEKTVGMLRTGMMDAQTALGELERTQAILLKEGRVQEAQEVTIAMRALQSGDKSAAQKTLMGTVVQLDQGK